MPAFVLKYARDGNRGSVVDYVDQPAWRISGREMADWHCTNVQALGVSVEEHQCEILELTWGMGSSLSSASLIPFVKSFDETPFWALSSKFYGLFVGLWGLRRSNG